MTNPQLSYGNNQQNQDNRCHNVLLLCICLLIVVGSTTWLWGHSSGVSGASAAGGQENGQEQQRHLRSNADRNDYDNFALPFRFLENDQCTQECCTQNFPSSCAENSSDNETNPFTKTPLAFQIVLIILLIFMSAFFSGLTLGLMSLDKTGLEIVMSGDDPKNAAYAKRIYPLRKRGNLLLCTLLLGNVCVNSLLSILTADKFGGAVGLVSSTFLIVIFGEIVPQALCQRYSLEVGSAAVPVVRVIMVILFPVAYPLSYALDLWLGEELATTYSNAEMLKLLQIHVQEEIIDPDTATAMKGALNYKSLSVKDVMTPLENTFMLSSDERLNFETIARIFKTGYSRIPVYTINKNNVIGLLLVKDLLFIDPEDETRIKDFVDIFGRRPGVVWPDDNLGDVLRELKSGKSHIALVRDVNNEDESQDPFYEIKGIITLEDIIEEILGDEIVDETDAFVDGTHEVPVDRAENFKWAKLRLLDSKLVDERLSYEETKAVTAHLSKNFAKIFGLITESQLHRLIMETPVSVFPTAEQTLQQDMPDDLLYECQKESDVCTLVLNGKLTVIAGADNFRSDVSSWSLLGGGALVDTPYKPDFSAWVSAGPCRCLQITRSRFATAIDASILERQDGSVKPGPPVEPPPPHSQDPTTEAKNRKGKLISALKALEGKTTTAESCRAAMAAAAVNDPIRTIPEKDASETLSSEDVEITFEKDEEVQSNSQEVPSASSQRNRNEPQPSEQLCDEPQPSEQLRDVGDNS